MTWKCMNVHHLDCETHPRLSKIEISPCYYKYDRLNFVYDKLMGLYKVIRFLLIFLLLLKVWNTQNWCFKWHKWEMLDYVDQPLTCIYVLPFQPSVILQTMAVKNNMTPSYSLTTSFVAKSLCNQTTCIKESSCILYMWVDTYQNLICTDW